MTAAAARLRDEAGQLRFSPPVTHVYNPLEYAWAAHARYIERYAWERKRVVFLGMNPGPFGMAQTGVPFGEVRAVRDWLGIKASVRKPTPEHPRREISGFDCPRTEISGQRLWNLFAGRFQTAERFFAEHFVVNYCPLAFMEASGANRTPDKLPGDERARLFEICDRHLTEVLRILQPEWLVALGDFALKRAQAVVTDGKPNAVRVLHPSPASPAANRDWAGAVTRELTARGIWEGGRAAASGDESLPNRRNRPAPRALP